VHSPNIVVFIEMMESSNYYYLIIELCDNDLTKIMTKGSIYPEEDSVGWLKQICNGMVTIVKEGIIHRYISTYLGISSRQTSL
jgi:serine/threonine protein kinase